MISCVDLCEVCALKKEKKKSVRLCASPQQQEYSGTQGRTRLQKAFVLSGTPRNMFSHTHCIVDRTHGADTAHWCAGVSRGKKKKMVCITNIQTLDLTDQPDIIHLMFLICWVFDLLLHQNTFFCTRSNLFEQISVDNQQLFLKTDLLYRHPVNQPT